MKLGIIDKDLTDMTKFIKPIYFIILLFVLSVRAQAYCEPPVRGVYESGPNLRDIFLTSKNTGKQTQIDIQGDFLLVPGVQAGKFFLGTGKKEISAVLPLGDSKIKKNPVNGKSNVFYESFAQGLGFYFDKDALVLIEVSNQDYKTRKGFGLGSGLLDLKNLDEKNRCTIKSKKISCKGIAYILDQQRVKTVHIFPKE